MRHSASMIVSLEGINRAVYRIAHELAQNSRSGLTVRFLSKKLELPQEEIEYLIDVNHKLLYTDLTKIKLPSEGLTAVKRISDGLENIGDVESLFRQIKALSSHDFRRLEEQLDVELGTKKAVGEYIVENFYKNPDSIMQYVASHGFSETAKEVFDILWQSKDGIMPVSAIRAAHGGTEYKVEQALWELFRGMALFEMFRYDNEDRLVRMAGLLTELRQWRSQQEKSGRRNVELEALKGSPGSESNRHLEFTEKICQLVSAIAAKPARLRGDGELFREDARRLSETIPEEASPSLAVCLWAAEGVGWIKRVETELYAGELEELIKVDYIDRHQQLCAWLLEQGDQKQAKRLLAEQLDDMKSNAWYPKRAFIEYAVMKNEESDPPVLKMQDGDYRYVSSGAATDLDTVLERAMEDYLYWLGIIETASDGFEDYFRVTPLGAHILGEFDLDPLRADYLKAHREIVVQPNFDIVVPTKDMDALLTVPLDQFAVRQSTGQATVYLLTKDSFTQALQEGHDGDAFVDFLVDYNRGGSLPKNVAMTLEDWRGGLRRVKVRTLNVLEIDDPLVMADLQHRRKFKKLLTPLDPHQFIEFGGADLEELSKLLEKDGFIVDRDEAEE